MEQLPKVPRLSKWEISGLSAAPLRRSSSEAVYFSQTEVSWVAENE